MNTYCPFSTDPPGIQYFSFSMKNRKMGETKSACLFKLEYHIKSLTLSCHLLNLNGPASLCSRFKSSEFPLPNVWNKIDPLNSQNQNISQLFDINVVQYKNKTKQKNMIFQFWFDTPYLSRTPPRFGSPKVTFNHEFIITCSWFALLFVWEIDVTEVRIWFNLKLATFLFQY